MKKLLLALLALFPAALFAQTGGGFPPAAKPFQIVCTTACNVSALKPGFSAVINKGTTTGRTSVTAISPDPDLQFTNMPSGNYILHGYVVGSGAISVGIRYQVFNNTTCTGSGGINANNVDQAGASQNIAINPFIDSTNAWSFAFFAGGSGGSTSGSMIFCWAQGASSATTTNVFSGAQMTLTRTN